jgi:hypothetical protein
VPRSLTEFHIASLSRNRAPTDGGMISGSAECFPLAGARWLLGSWCDLALAIIHVICRADAG